MLCLKDDSGLLQISIAEFWKHGDITTIKSDKVRNTREDDETL